MMGGQVKIDVNLLSDMMFSAVGSENATPSAQVVSVLKPAALAFLEIMSGVATKETVALTPAEKKEKKKDNDSSKCVVLSLSLFVSVSIIFLNQHQ